MASRFFIAFFFLLSLVSYSQVDQHRLDSFIRAVDSSANARQKWLDSFKKRQDSIYKASLQTVDKRIDSLLNDEEKHEGEKEQKKILLSIAVGVLLFIVLIFVLRRYRSKT